MQEALVYAKKAIDVDKFNLQGIFFLGNLYAKMKDFRSAITQYKQVLCNFIINKEELNE